MHGTSTVGGDVVQRRLEEQTVHEPHDRIRFVASDGELDGRGVVAVGDARLPDRSAAVAQRQHRPWQADGGDGRRSALTSIDGIGVERSVRRLGGVMRARGRAADAR